ncbi:hypothetical protein AB3X90_40925, partial [Paraburkholderia sp. BR14427]
HMGMHHIDDNLPRDLSSTMRFQRDSVIGFLHYYLRFAALVPVPIFPRGSLNFRTRERYAETVSHIVRSAGARMLLTSNST